MDLGLHIVRFDWPGAPDNTADVLAGIGRAADDAGMTHLSVMDHYFQIGMTGPPEDPMLEGYLAALHLAHATTRARVGVLATGSQYRYPALLIKIVTTLDVLATGRAPIIPGAGRTDEESIGLGRPMPSLAERFARLSDGLGRVRPLCAAAAYSRRGGTG